MSSYMHHMSVDVQGMLNHFKRKKTNQVMTDDNGRLISAEEVRTYLKECLAKGWKVIPMTSKPCEGFDYFGKGCPGHPVHEETEAVNNSTTITNEQ